MSNSAYDEYFPEGHKLHPPSADELLRLYRQRSGFTQDQLAALLGFGSKRMVRKWEDSLSLPEPITLRKIIEFYLDKGIFVSGEEYQEVSQLWAAVKNNYEATGVSSRIYPPFDHNWFDNLAKPPSNATTASQHGEQPQGGLLKQLLPPTPAPIHNLPAPLTSFIGRKKELQQLTLLLPTTRCLTLTGTGGIGKTRLALELAGFQRGSFKDGTWFIELAALTTAEQVTQAVARTLEVTEKLRQPLSTTLTDFLKDREVLLILDNCEHLASDCAALATELLSYCPSLKVLATSRERLRIAGELTWQVPALSLSVLERFPESDDTAPEKESDEQPSPLPGTSLPDTVELLLERVRAVRAGFSLNSRNTPAVYELCKKLEGLPLAIELAAVRARVLSIEEINDRLAERFQLLTGGSKSALPRQQTLKALIDWSYDLLDEKEQKLLERLAIFTGGFSLEAVETVCSGEDIRSEEVTGLLLELVIRSLVTARRSSSQPNLYNQLETLRQYGQARLEDGGMVEHFKEKHFNYYLEFMGGHQLALKGPDQKETAELIEREYLNCQKALTWALDRQDKTGALKMCEKLFPFWELRSYLTEGKSLVERSLEMPGPIETIQWAKALIHLARFCEIQGDYKTGLEYALEGRELSQNSGDDNVITTNLSLLGSLNMWLGNNQVAWAYFRQTLDFQRNLNLELGLAITLANMGLLALFESDYQTATSLLLEALELYQKIGYDHGTSRVINLLGNINLEQGNYEAARNYYKESARMSRTLGNRELEASTLTNLGIVAFQQGDYRLAKTAYLESLTLHKAVGNKTHAANVLANLGEVCGTLGDYTSARNYTLEALTIKREIGDKLVQAICLNNLGNFATNQGDYEEALAYCQESLAIRRELGSKQGTAFCYRNLGNLASLQGNYDAAQQYYLQSLEIQRSIGAISAIVTCLVNLVLLATRQGRTTQAEVYLLEAVQLSRESKNQLELACLLVAAAILWSESTTKADHVIHFIELVETLVSASGGVLEEIYFQPYTKAKAKFELQPFLELTGQTCENNKALDPVEEAHVAFRLIAFELQAGGK